MTEIFKRFRLISNDVVNEFFRIALSFQNKSY